MSRNLNRTNSACCSNMPIAGPVFHLFWYFFSAQISSLNPVVSSEELAVLGCIGLCCWKCHHKTPFDSISANTDETDWSFYQLLVYIFIFILFFVWEQLNFNLQLSSEKWKSKLLRIKMWEFFMLLACDCKLNRGAALLGRGWEAKHPYWLSLLFWKSQ